MTLFRLTLLFAIMISSAYAQSGLLLGVYGDETSSVPATYKTFWVMVENGKPQIAAVLADVIVPRKDGFWRVGVYETSYTSHYGPDSFMDLPPHGDLYFQDTAARVYVVPANQVPNVEVPAGVRRPVAVPAKSSERAGNGESAVEDIEGQQLKTDNDEPCNSETIQITYVDPSRIGLMARYGQSEFCAPARYAQFGSNDLFYIDDYLAQKLGEGAPPIAFTSMLTKTQRRAILDQVADEGVAGEPRTLGSIALVPVRGKGRWEVRGWSGGSIASRGGHDLEDTIAAPAELIPRRPTPSALLVQLRGISDLQDYFISPSNDLVVAIIQQRLVAYSVVAGKLGRAVEIHRFAGQQLHPAVSAVMAEWVTGRYVRLWDNQLRALKLPPVDVKRVASTE